MQSTRAPLAANVHPGGAHYCGDMSISGHAHGGLAGRARGTVDPVNIIAHVTSELADFVSAGPQQGSIAKDWTKHSQRSEFTHMPPEKTAKVLEPI